MSVGTDSAFQEAASLKAAEKMGIAAGVNYLQYKTHRIQEVALIAWGFFLVSQLAELGLKARDKGDHMSHV